MIEPATFLLVAAASLAVGSFMALVVRRSATGRSVVGARSACEACGNAIAPRHLIPIVSALVLRGRCAACGAAFSPFHFAMEAGALVVAVSAMVFLPAESLAAGLWFGWVLLLLAGFDASEFVLPLPLTLALLATGLAEAAWIEAGWPVDRLIGAGAGLLSFAAIAAAYRFWRGRDGLGGGDVLLFGAAGAWLGWAALSWVALGAAMSAIAFVALRSALKGTALRASDKLPFGVFLALATWTVFLAIRA